MWQLIGTLAKVFGALVFAENDGSGKGGSGIDGGAIYTTSFSQVELHQGASIALTDNVGVWAGRGSRGCLCQILTSFLCRFGAALIVDNMAAASLPPAYGHIQYNPLCVLRYEDLTVLPDYWEDVSQLELRLHDNGDNGFQLCSLLLQVLIEFHNNSARYGSSVLTSKLEFCSFPDRDLDRVFRWNFTDFGYIRNDRSSSCS